MDRTAVPTRCPHCGAPLSALATRGGEGHCGAAACRHREDSRRTAGQHSIWAERVSAAAQTQGLPTAAQPVWLLHWDTVEVAVTEAERREHAAVLAAMWEAPVEAGDDVVAADLAEAVAERRQHVDAGAAQAGRLCGQCRGRCCRFGASHRAFIDRGLLQRWIDRRPGASPADAVQAYLDALPATHLAGGCLYQTGQGCALPRDRRADLCNRYACEALQQVQAAAQDDPTVRLLAISTDGGEIAAAALIDADGTRPIALGIGP